MSLCLRRLKIDNPAKHIKLALGDPTYESGLDPISVLALKFDLTTVDRLWCTFIVSEKNMAVPIHAVRRLAYFLRSLRSLRSVSLLFAGDTCCCCGTPQFDEGWMEEWVEAFSGLMGAVMGCGTEKLKMKGGRYLCHLFVFKFGKSVGKKAGRAPPPPNVKHVKSRWKALENFSFKNILKGGRKASGPVVLKAQPVLEPISILTGEGWEFRRVNNGAVGASLSQLQHPGKINTTLQALDIQSMMLLMPPLLQWTVSALQYSSLRKLTLKNIAINHKCWPAIFELISSAAPGITELVLRKVKRIEGKDLLAFLCKMTALTALTIGRDVDGWDGMDLGPFPELAKLVTLSAPASWIARLLTAHPRGLENLENLHVSYKMRNDGLSHWLQPSSTPSVPSLIRTQRRILTVSLEVVLGSSPGWKMFEDLNTAEKADSAMQKEKGKGCRDAVADRALISSICLVVNQEFSKEDVNLWTVLPKWWALFPGLRHVSLTGSNSAIRRVDAVEMMKRAVEESGLGVRATFIVSGKEEAFNRPKE